MQFYRFLLSAGVLAAIVLAGCSSPTSTTTSTPPPAVVSPTVSSVSPMASATGIGLNQKLQATFSDAMDGTTLTTASVLVTYPVGTPGVTTSVAGTVATAGNVVTFTPGADLVATKVYTATVTTAAKNLAGTALAANFTWTFTTGAAADTTPPTVASVTPLNAATGVDVAANLTATFSEAPDGTTLNGTTVTLSPAAAGAITVSGNTMTFNPTASLAYATVYTATITTGAKDLAGNPLAADKVWTFTTGPNPDVTAPTVISVTPLNAATGVAVATTVTATFSEAVDAATLSASTFTLNPGSVAGAYVLSVDKKTVTFTPDSSLASATVYTAAITTGAKDLAGNALAANKVWTFTTAPAPLAALDLGTAANYVILAKSKVTTVPTSIVTGDIGLFPAAAAANLGGFALTLSADGDFSTDTSQVTGKIYAADYLLTTHAILNTATNDQLTAYNDAAGRASTTTTELGAGHIGGMSLVAGVYTWSTSVGIATDLTLTGSAADVWIFQVGQDLTIATAAKITLAGGALAKNIFWQVAGSTQLGASTIWEGNILGKTTIAVLANAVVHGRLLSQTDVTLISDTVSLP